jgi:hypothetical protein
MLQLRIEMARDSIESVGNQGKFTSKVMTGAKLSLTVGLATWALRAGSLVATAISSMPLWKGFDPLPVLPLSSRERREKIMNVRTMEEEESEKDKEIVKLFENKKDENVRTSSEGDES